MTRYYTGLLLRGSQVILELDDKYFPTDADKQRELKICSHALQELLDQKNSVLGILPPSRIKDPVVMLPVIA